MTSPPAPISEKRLSNLYKGTTTNVMFRQFARAFSGSNSRDIISTISKDELPEADTGFEFFSKVQELMHQDINEKIPVGWACWDGTSRWRVELSPSNNDTGFLLKHYYIRSVKSKPNPYFAINLQLAQSMAWVVATDTNT